MKKQVKSTRTEFSDPTPEICARLRKHILTLDSENDLLFPNQKGGYLVSNSFDKVLAWLADTVIVDPGPPERKLHRCTPHGIRHTAGTALAYADLGEKKIQLHLGHADTQMVQQYIHIAQKPDHNLNRRLMAQLKKARRRIDDHYDAAQTGS